MLKRVLYALLFLLALPLVLWIVSRLLGPSPSERRALALMEQPWQPEGRNAYADFWLVDYPLDTAERDAIMAEDVQRFAALRPDAEGVYPDFVGSAGERSTSQRPDDQSRGLLCRLREDCLGKVRADLPAYRALIDENSAWLDRVEQAVAGDYLQLPFSPRIDAPLPAFQATFAPGTRYAVQFAAGDQLTALDGVCRAMSDWRRLGSNTDMLLVRMVAAAYAGQGYGRLAADMLAEIRVDAALPASCQQAFALPRLEEVSICRAMRGDFAFIQNGLRNGLEPSSSKYGRLRTWLFLDADMTRAQSAKSMAALCNNEHQQAILQDQAMPPAVPAGFLRIQCVSNSIGCILSEIAVPAYHGYADRMRDFMAMQRTLAGLVWLRDKPALLVAPETIPAAWPGQFKSAAHPLNFDTETRQLSMPMLGKNAQGKPVKLPLPGSRVVTAN